MCVVPGEGPTAESEDPGGEDTEIQECLREGECNWLSLRRVALPLASHQVKEVREVRDARVRQRREEMEGKLQRAEVLRSSHLQEIVRKAQEEDAKVAIHRSQVLELFYMCLSLCPAR